MAPPLLLSKGVLFGEKKRGEAGTTSIAVCLSIAATAIFSGCLPEVGVGSADQNFCRSQHALVGNFQTPTGQVRASYIQEGDYAIIGGDMRVPMESLQTDSMLISSTEFGTRLWPNGQVPYQISAIGTSSLARQAAQDGVALWNSLSDQTGVTFIPRNGQTDYVRIGSAEDGCFSLSWVRRRRADS